MAEPIEFWFDFSSPYSYLASERIDELAAKYGRKVKWRPVMLGAALMGLVFLSSGSGHDEAIEDPFEDDPDLKP